MAFSITVLGSTWGLTTNTATYNSPANYTAATNSLLIAFLVANQSASSVLGGVGGLGLNWQLGTFVTYGTTNTFNRITSFWATTGGWPAPTVGTMRATYSSSQRGAAMAVYQIHGYDRNNPTPIQYKMASYTAATMGATLSALATAANWVFAGWGDQISLTSAGVWSGGIRDAYATHASPAQSIVVGHGSNVTVPTCGFNTSGAGAVLAMEIRAQNQYNQSGSSFIPSSPRSPSGFANFTRLISHYLEPVFSVGQSLAGGAASYARTLFSIIPGVSGETTAGSGALTYSFDFEQPTMASFVTDTGWSYGGTPAPFVDTATKYSGNSSLRISEMDGYEDCGIGSPMALDYVEQYTSFWFNLATISFGQRELFGCDIYAGGGWQLRINPITDTSVSVSLFANYTDQGSLSSTLYAGTWAKIYLYGKAAGANSTFSLSQGEATLVSHQTLTESNIYAENFGVSGIGPAAAYNIDGVRIGTAGFYVESQQGASQFGMSFLLQRAISRTRSFLFSIGPIFSAKRIGEYLRWPRTTVQPSWIPKRSKWNIKSILNSLPITGIVSKSGAKLRSLSSSLGITSSISRISQRIRGITLSLPILFSMSRSKDFLRGLSTAITISYSSKRIGDYIRKISKLRTRIVSVIGNVVSSSTIYYRTILTRIGNAISSGLFGAGPMFGPLGGGPLGGLGAGDDVNPRTFSVVASIVGAVTTYFRNLLSSLVIGGSVKRISERIRRITISLTPLFSVKRIRELLRSVPAGPSMSLVVKRIGSFIRVLQSRVSRAMALAQSKMGTYVRTLTTSLSPVPTVIRQVLISLYVRTLSTVKTISNISVKTHRAFDHFDGPALDGIWRDYSLAPLPHQWKISDSVVMVDGTNQNLTAWYGGSCFAQNQSATICLGSSVPTYGTGWQVGIYLRALDCKITGLRAEYAKLAATQNDLRIYGYGTYLDAVVFSGILWSTTLGTMLGKGDILSVGIYNNNVKMYVNGELAGTTIWTPCEVYVGSPGWFILNYTNPVPYTDGFMGIDWWSAEPVIWSSAKVFASPKSYLWLLLLLTRGQITRVRNAAKYIVRIFLPSRIGEYIRRMTHFKAIKFVIDKSSRMERSISMVITPLFSLIRIGKYIRRVLTSLGLRILPDWISSAEKKWMKWKMMLFQKDKFKESGKESDIYKTDTKEQDRYKT